jgi:hypothetical protein
MKIKIKTNDYREFKEFSIVTLKHELDENGIPVDIVITGTEEVLNAISEFAHIGCNIQELSSEPWNICPSLIIKGATHEALYARLNSFEVLEADKVIYE